MAKLKCASLLVIASCLYALPITAQVVKVDMTPSHATNHFVPKQTLGAGIDRIQTVAIDKLMNKTIFDRVFTAGWQPVTYRQNTELAIEAWHWNPDGTWSDPKDQQGYFTGSAEPIGFIRHSFGYALPHRGITRDGGSVTGYSRLTDGDTASYWKSNPYLSKRFTGEDDALHPQWVLMDLSSVQLIDSMKIAWTNPYATQYTVQYWTGTLPYESPLDFPTNGVWQTFPHGVVNSGKGGVETVHLSDQLIPARYLRIVMTHSSDTCDTHGSSDPRNCVGYAIDELYAGTSSADGSFHDVVRHTADQQQTVTEASSVDSWHTAKDLLTTKESQMGFDLFYTSGVTQGLPAIIPIALIYDNPDNAAAEIKYLEARHYPISYVEMGEEADGQYIAPEDVAALYIQFATAIHRVDPNIKLGGPSFEGVNRDILYWPTADGKASWLGRFLDYLRQHGHLQDLAFFSFEHYPLGPCEMAWSSLYDEPQLVANIMKTWRNDGLPANVPMLITESNLSSASSETYMDIFAGVWLADYVGSFLNAGGKGLYYFHYLPLQMENGCNNSPGTFGMFTVNANYQIQQPLSQYFASRMINFEWLQHDGGEHTTYPATGTYDDGAHHTMVTAYSVLRPDHEWSVMLVNRDQEQAHKVQVVFDSSQDKTESYFSGDVHVSTFGRDQYKWHPAFRHADTSHIPETLDKIPLLYTDGYADPDGPIQESTVRGDRETEYEIPPASIVVLRGNLDKSNRTDASASDSSK
ncbi:MAG TPA: discoidin domain-containing protein [Acidobacteriaceae bacterium]|nr:discoidin domain-containing protein [Acidobacteriaceae bacterium]